MIRPAILLVPFAFSAVLAAMPDRFPPLAADPGNLGPALASPSDATSLADRLRLLAAPLQWRALLQGEERVVYIGDTPLHRETKRYLALDAAGLRASALLLPCPSQVGAHGCLALPTVLDENARRAR
ncbi:MAG: hypothetical protein HY554_15970 [Elusimicrobia bacterium]|nr:hypothetical protein [Elusimicrobiota bacterium]